MTVTDNTALQRFELEENGLVAFANYRRSSSQVTIPHVEAPPALRGKGTAGRLMKGIVEKARAEGFKIRPTCSYAVLWFGQHKNSSDVLV
jgi:predicted GNAT family acetyltransferase